MISVGKIVSFCSGFAEIAWTWEKGLSGHKHYSLCFLWETVSVPGADSDHWVITLSINMPGGLGGAFSQKWKGVLKLWWWLWWGNAQTNVVIRLLSEEQCVVKIMIRNHRVKALHTINTTDSWGSGGGRRMKAFWQSTNISLTTSVEILCVSECSIDP